MKLNPRAIHEIAARLFWTWASDQGIAHVTERVIATGGQCLMHTPFTDEILVEFGFADISGNERTVALDAIAAEAHKHAEAGQNMIGIIYPDDAQTGRSPSAEDVQTEHLQSIPKSMVRTGPSLEEIGTLCIRHPLPAVLFSKKRPLGGIVKVADTSDALGFQMPMYLAIHNSQEVGDALYASSGVFFIPAPDAQKGAWWMAVIQNASSFTDTLQYQVGNDLGTINAIW